MFNDTYPHHDFEEENEFLIHVPRVRTWELNENSTRYDRLVAAPPDSQIHTMSLVWSVIAVAAGIWTTGIFLPLLFSKPVQKNPFNLYLIFLMGPDVAFNWLCAWTCLQTTITGSYPPGFMCKFQSFYVTFTICANSNLNALVARQLYTMLSSAAQYRRYNPPTHKQVTVESLAVYLYSFLVASMVLWDESWWPHKTQLVIGAVCLPMEYDVASSIFFYCFFFLLVFFFPFLFVIWASYYVWQNNLLPQRGRRRVIAIYYFRLAMVFVVFWVPGLFLVFVGGSAGPWVQWAGGSWSHMQGAVSGLASLFKADIWKAVTRFWTCGMMTKDGDDMDDSNHRSNSGTTTDVITMFSSVMATTRASVLSTLSGHRRSVLFPTHTKQQERKEGGNQEIGECMAMSSNLELGMSSSDSSGLGASPSFAEGQEEEPDIAAMEDIADLGMSCTEKRSGSRCIEEEEGPARGESHAPEEMTDQKISCTGRGSIAPASLKDEEQGVEECLGTRGATELGMICSGQEPTLPMMEEDDLGTRSSAAPTSTGVAGMEDSSANSLPVLKLG